MSAQLSPHRTKKIICSLDLPNISEMRKVLTLFSPWIDCFKIGYELIFQEGLAPLIHEMSKFEPPPNIFADVKLNDIPRTVQKAAKTLSSYHVQYFNIHASSGEASIKAAVDAKGNSKVLVVTLLTSLSHNEISHVFSADRKEVFMRFADMALRCGADGLILSAEELSYLASEKKFERLEKITPGIRPSWSSTSPLPSHTEGKDDQSRIATPKMALDMGATALVIGRPILFPPPEIFNTPVDALQSILRDIGEI